MTDREIDKLLSEHFTHLDRLVTEQASMKNGRQRGPIVMALPEVERNLYFVFDVVGITCNAGMGAWIHYHIDDQGWIDDAVRAFEAIGHRNVGRDLKACRDRYVAATGDLADWNDDDLSEAVWDLEDQITRDLYRHLLDAGFIFRRPEGGAQPE